MPDNICKKCRAKFCRANSAERKKASKIMAKKTGKKKKELQAEKRELAMIEGILEGSPDGIGVVVVRLDCGCRKMAAVAADGEPASKVIMYRDLAESICDMCKEDNGDLYAGHRILYPLGRTGSGRGAEGNDHRQGPRHLPAVIRFPDSITGTAGRSSAVPQPGPASVHQILLPIPESPPHAHGYRGPGHSFWSDRHGPRQIPCPASSSGPVPQVLPPHSSTIE